MSVCQSVSQSLSLSSIKFFAGCHNYYCHVQQLYFFCGRFALDLSLVIAVHPNLHDPGFRQVRISVIVSSSWKLGTRIFRNRPMKLLICVQPK